MPLTYYCIFTSMLELITKVGTYFSSSSTGNAIDNKSHYCYCESELGKLIDLENILKREVDLISYRVVKNPIFKKELDTTKVALYAA